MKKNLKWLLKWLLKIATVTVAGVVFDLLAYGKMNLLSEVISSCIIIGFIVILRTIYRKVTADKNSQHT